MNTQVASIGPPPRIAVEWCGSGPLVLMLHGIGGNRRNWHEQLPVYGRRFTAAAWDARGYGDSDDYQSALDFADFSADLLRVLAYFGVGSVHLVGLSMGGRIALDFTGRHPQRVASLVLADTSAGSAEVASPEQIEAFLLARKRPLLEGRTPAQIAEEIGRTLVGRSISPHGWRQVVDSLSALHTESYLKTLDTVTRYTQFPDPSTIAVPALVVVGEDDTIAKPDYARSMAARLPRGEFVQLPRTGHLSNIEHPAAFNAVVLAFLERQRGRAPDAVPEPQRAAARERLA